MGNHTGFQAVLDAPMIAMIAERLTNTIRFAKRCEGLNWLTKSSCDKHDRVRCDFLVAMVLEITYVFKLCLMEPMFVATAEQHKQPISLAKRCEGTEG